MGTLPDHAIELSRKKLLGMALLMLVVGAIGVLLFTLSDEEIHELRRLSNPTLVHVIATLMLLISGGMLFYVGRKLFDDRPGVVLSSQGILINSGAVMTGLVPWEDITGTRIYEANKARMLIILVADPEKYIALGGPLRRALNRTNTKMSGSPISIAATALKIRFEELCKLVETYRAAYAR